MKVLKTDEVFDLIEQIKKTTNYFCLIVFNILLMLSSILFLVFQKKISADTSFTKIITYILIGSIILALLAIIIYKKKNKKMLEGEINISSSANLYVEYFKEKVKKAHKWYLIILSVLIFVALIVLSKIAFSIQDNEFVEYSAFYFNLILAATILVKKIILTKKINKIIFNVSNEEVKEEKFNLKKAKRRNITYVVIYWIIAISLSILFGYYTDAWYSIWIVITIFALVFLLNAMIISPFNFFRQYEKKKLSVRTIKIVIIGLIVFGLFYVMELGSFYLLPYVTFTSKLNNRSLPITYSENDGSFTITNEKSTDFKILQITDVHIGGSFITIEKDKNALSTIRSLVFYTSPDLIVVTGDLVYPFALQSFNFNNYSAFSQFVMFMDKLGVPWAFTYGNHDTEKYATSTHEDFVEILNKYSFKNNGKLLYSDMTKNIDGRSNQLIIINNSDESINQLLFLFDSNSYINSAINNYDYIHDNQVDWYKDRVRHYNSLNYGSVSSLAFFHIPLTETIDAYDACNKASSTCKYLFGEVREKISASDYKSKLFDTALELGSTKAMFYGHDHQNTIGLEYYGIKLVYGMSIDYLATPKIASKVEQRGGTLITVHEDSSFDIEQIKYVDIK